MVFREQMLSIHKNDNTIRFNFDYELGRLLLKESVEDKLIALGVEEDKISKAIDTIAYRVVGKGFDGDHLTTSKLIESCKSLKIDSRELFGDYDRFIVNNWSDTILKYRRKSNLSQKELAK